LLLTWPVGGWWAESMLCYKKYIGGDVWRRVWQWGNNRAL
jgi:hypothetical protein